MRITISLRQFVVAIACAGAAVGLVLKHYLTDDRRPTEFSMTIDGSSDRIFYYPQKRAVHVLLQDSASNASIGPGEMTGRGVTYIVETFDRKTRLEIPMEFNSGTLSLATSRGKQLQIEMGNDVVGVVEHDVSEVRSVTHERGIRYWLLHSKELRAFHDQIDQLLTK